MNVAIDTSAARARTSDGSGPGCLFKEFGESGIRSVAGASINQFIGVETSPERDEDSVFADP